MACSCRNKAKSDNIQAGPRHAVVRKGTEVNQNRTSADRSSYSEPLSCSMCYSKHLAKAYVEYREYLDDRSRGAELAMAIGDAACAEDHAVSLGLNDAAAAIRALRGRMWSADRSVCQEILDMAAKAASDAVARSAEDADARRARSRELFMKAVAERKAASNDASNE